MSDQIDLPYYSFEYMYEDHFRLVWHTLIENFHANPYGVAGLIFDDQVFHTLSEDGGIARELLKTVLYRESDKLLAQFDMCLALNSCSFVIIANKHNRDSSLVLAHKLVHSTLKAPEIAGLINRDFVSTVMLSGLDENGLTFKAEDRAAFSLDQNEIDPDNAPDLELLGKASFDFLPILNVKRGFVMNYECIPRWHLENGHILDEDDLSKRFSDHNMEYALDGKTIIHAVEQIVDIIEHDAMAGIVVPVHYDTIMEELGFNHFLESLGVILHEWKQRLTMEIKCIPQDVSFDQLRQAVSRIVPFSNSVFIQTHFDHPLLGDFAIDVPVSVGVDITHDKRAEKLILDDMEAFISKVRQYENLEAHVFGIQSVSLSVGAICSGFDQVGCVPVQRELAGWGIDDFMIKPKDLYKHLK